MRKPRQDQIAADTLNRPLRVSMTGWLISLLICAAALPVLANPAKNTKATASQTSQKAAQQHYLRGERLEQQGDIAGAIKEYQTALKLKPTSTATKLALERLQKKQAEENDRDKEGSSANDKDWPPSEAQLADLLEKGCYGTEADRQAANSEFLRVLSNDIVSAVQYVYYPVTGSTENDIVASEKNSSSLRGTSEYGYTKYDWSGQPSPGIVMQLSLRTTITLPQWTPDQGASPELISKWTFFIHALVFHEQGHALIAEYGLAVMRIKINQAQNYALASSLCAQEADRMQALSDEYDQRTQHGGLQGANF